MSVVAVRKYPDRLDFAADSIRTVGYRQESQRVTELTKLVEVNDMTIGGVGYSVELSFLFLFAKTHKPKAATTDAVLDFLVEFYDWARAKNESFGRQNHYLLGFQGEAFRICDGYLVDRINEFGAIGAGEDFALTAMHLGKTETEAIEVASEL